MNEAATGPENAGSRPVSARRIPRHRKTILAATLVLATCVVSWLIGLPEFGGVKQFREAGAIAVQPGGVEFRADTPDVTIRPSADDRIHVSARGEYSGARPLLSINKDQGGVLVIVDCYAEPTRRCQLAVDLELPHGTPLRAKTSTGPLDIAGLSGPTYLRTDSGAITLNQMSGSVNVYNLSGSTRGTELGGRRLTVTSNSGLVDLALTEVPASVRIDSGEGRISLVVPQATYRVRVAGGSGTARVSVPRSAVAFPLLDLSTDKAPLQVRPGAATSP